MTMHRYKNLKNQHPASLRKKNKATTGKCPPPLNASVNSGSFGAQPSEKKTRLRPASGLPAVALAKAGGGGGNRTRVRKLSATGFYMLSLQFNLTG